MDTQSSQNEDLKRRLKEATDIIKSRDETIAARNAQIAGLQSELDDLRMQLPEAKLKAAELEADLKKTKGDPEKPCLELQDALSKQLPPEIRHKMLPASRTIALRQTSKTNTLTSLSLYLNNLGEGGGRALAEALRLNSTLKSLDLGYNDLVV